MQKILLLITLCCFGIAVQAQTAPITRISIKNEEARPVENATVELLLSKDSSLVKTALTDAAGVAELDVRHDGDYLLMVSAVGYNSFSKLVSINGGSLSASEFVLKNKAAEMQTVTVTARRRARGWSPSPCCARCCSAGSCWRGRRRAACVPATTAPPSRGKRSRDWRPHAEHGRHPRGGGGPRR